MKGLRFPFYMLPLGMIGHFGGVKGVKGLNEQVFANQG